MKKNPSPAKRVRKPVPAVQENSPASQKAVSFPIIGIGASACGFEALEQFMAHVPAGCGMAFVIVQHLDPTRKGLMPYRTPDDCIDGVVISYWGITEAKELEARPQEMQLALENRLAGKSTELDKAKIELKAERKRTRSVTVKPRKN
jgi:hypothetical protein